MADKSAIEWTDATWNPITGCSIVSPGCTNCYAMKLAGTRLKHIDSRKGLTRDTKAGPVWTGEVRLNRQWLYQPLDWRKPRRIFVCAHGDLFAENVPDEWIDKMFAVMAMAPQHTFQVLTKRAKRIRRYLSNPDTPRRIYELVCDLVTLDDVPAVLLAPGIDDPGLMPPWPRVHLGQWPLPNVWLGVSAERQQEADARIPQLLATPAAVRFVSAEPLLGPIDFTKVQRFDEAPKEFVHALAGRFWTDQTGLPKPDPSWAYPGRPFSDGGRGLDWIIVGGESGPDARPMHPDWARDIRDDCKNAGVSFFFKQWGEWAPGECAPRMQLRTERGATWFNEQWIFESITPAVGQSLHRDDAPDVYRFGKRDLTRTLDGIEHNAMPEVPA
ncbi:phage Gp37/Gp68 family protein [Mesorhizobium sp. M0910]|uniref:DUF5131 family protein n=1 Tax=Mesorhizobium sp. M0910 TaxID=2957025 RepID=UPI00333BB4F1